MNLIYYHFLAISFTLQVSRTAPPKKPMFFQIDEFIKQLMTSERFDELTDIIADKAAQKIRNIDGQSNSHVGKSILRNLDKKQKNDPISEEKSNYNQEHSNDKDLRSDEKSTYDHEKNRSKAKPINEKSNQNHDRNKQDDVKSDYEKINHDRDDNKGKDSRSREKSIYGHDKQKYKSSKSDEKIRHDRQNPDLNSPKKTENTGEIDTQMFLQNQMASKELELNFKHLKGELEKHRFNIKGNNIKSHKSYDKSKRNEHGENNRAVDKQEDEDENTSIKSKLKKLDSKELLLLDGSDENEAHEQDTFHNDDDNIKHTQSSGENKSTNDSDAVIEENSNKGFKYDHNSNEKPIPRITKQNNSEEDPKSEEDMETAKAFIDKVMEKVSQELNNPSFSSKEVLVVGLNRAQSEPEDKISIRLENPQSKSNVEVTKHEDEANEKLSTVRTSAEYAEYHENSVKPPQSKFINTYK